MDEIIEGQEAQQEQIFNKTNLQLHKISDAVDKIKGELQKVIIGQHDMIELLIAGLFTNGHMIIEGVPGIAKTLTAKLMAKTLNVDFKRIQFTPDLMPTDVIGTSIFNLKTSDFTFNKGPVFSNFVLIDEINRAPAKTQAALFEVMEEQQVTIDGKTHKMSFPFVVIATQNPIEQEGTYKLPEAQLDRFVFKIKLDYPTLEEEKAILYRFREDFSMRQANDVQAVMDATEIKECQNIIEQVYIKDQLLDYIAGIINNTRNNGDLYLGASPRASLAIMRTSKAIAAMNGRDFVTPDDIKTVAYPVLNHRIILMPEREMEGITARDVINDIVKKIEVPR
jgi:MoxR-like ATPase